MNALPFLLLFTGVTILASFLPDDMPVTSVLNLVALLGYIGVFVYFIWLSIFSGGVL